MIKSVKNQTQKRLGLTASISAKLLDNSNNDTTDPNEGKNVTTKLSTMKTLQLLKLALNKSCTVGLSNWIECGKH